MESAGTAARRGSRRGDRRPPLDPDDARGDPFGE
eukprot:gene53121-27194_t